MKPEEKIKEQIRDKMGTQVIEDMPMSRIPRRTKAWFIDYAKDYFCDDRGMCFKHIIDTFRGMTPVGYDELQTQIDQLGKELELVTNTLMEKKEKSNTVRMADGTEKRR